MHMYTLIALMQILLLRARMSLVLLLKPGTIKDAHFCIKFYRIRHIYILYFRKKKKLLKHHFSMHNNLMNFSYNVDNSANTQLLLAIILRKNYLSIHGNFTVALFLFKLRNY